MPVRLQDKLPKCKAQLKSQPTSFCSLTDSVSDLAPSSENAFPRACPSQAPRSLTALPKSDSDCPNSENRQKQFVQLYSNQKDINT